MNLPDPTPRLFDERALATARRQHDDSHFRWLALSEAPEAMSLRRALQSCWELAGGSRGVLRKGLAHERWGQHAGAMAHLLALGLFGREGYAVECEPDLGRQSPDLLARKDGAEVLVEVRAITGCGSRPWEDPTVLRARGGPGGEAGGNGAGRGDEQPLSPEQIEAILRTPPSAAPPEPTGNGREHPPLPPHDRRVSRAASEKAARTRARRLAAERAKAARALERDLRDVVLKVLEKKAAAYKDLCAHTGLPYLICLYQDTDDQLTPIVCDWAFGAGGREQDPEGGWHSTHDPKDGVFFGDRWHFGHVAGVLVFGRVDAENGRVALQGDVIRNPFAEPRLPRAATFPHLREYRLRTNVKPPRMRWTPFSADPLEIAPQP